MPAQLSVPAQADPQLGGFVIDTKVLGAASVGDRVRATLQGYWGFEKYNAPSFELVNLHDQTWEMAAPVAVTPVAEWSDQLLVSCVELTPVPVVCMAAARSPCATTSCRRRRS